MLYSEFYYLEINFNSLTELNLVFCFYVSYMYVYILLQQISIIYENNLIILVSIFLGPVLVRCKDLVDMFFFLLAINYNYTIYVLLRQVTVIKLARASSLVLGVSHG